MARRVRFFSSQIEKEKEPINVRPLYEQDMGSLITVGPRGPLAIDELDTKLAAHEARLLQMNESYETLSERSRELIEARHVLRETAVFFQQVCVVLNLIRIAVTNIFSRLKATIAKLGRHLMTVLPLCCNMMTQKISSLANSSQAAFSLI